MEQIQAVPQDLFQILRIRFRGKNRHSGPWPSSIDVVFGLSQQRCCGCPSSYPQRACKESSSVKFHEFAPNAFSPLAELSAREATARVAQSATSSDSTTLARRVIRV